MAKLDKWRYFHGENSITFCLFSTFNKKQLSSLLSHAQWHIPDNTTLVPDKTKAEQIQYLHLFPNFGKRYGYGEPDVVIITDNFVVYVEVELADFSKSHIPDCFIKQMKMFVKLGSELHNKKITRLRKKFIGESGYSFFGGRGLRRIFKQIKEKDRKPCFLVISESNSLDAFHRLRDKLNLSSDILFGCVGFRKIKWIKGSGISNIINDALEKRKDKV